MSRITIKYIVALLVSHATFYFAKAQKQVTVTVKVHNSTGSSVSLYKVENGEAKRMSFRWPAKNDTCVFSFPLEQEAVFYLGKTGGKGSDHKYVLYLKPGENKWVNAYISKLSIDFDSCKIIKPDTETLLLQKWTNLLNEYCKLGSNRGKREQFIAEYDNFIKEAEQLKKKAVLSNKYFNQLFISKIDAEIIYPKVAAFFNFGIRMNVTCDTAKMNAAFYRSLADEKFCDAKLLQSEHGLELVNYTLGYRLLQQYGSQEKMLATPFVQKAKMICGESVRGAYVFNRMEQVRSYEQFKTEILPFKSLFASASFKTAFEKKEDELTIFAKGAPAYNFSLEDTKGQMVSLSDFKGKVVVLDIWAMWCAPCLTEKPFYQKVEEEFKHRDDIVFIGISHDGLSKKEVWKNFVAKKGWKNIELIANYDESVGKYYKIEGIPRFMIFDKEGKIVTVDAPRPSDPGFKKLIEETLNAKG